MATEVFACSGCKQVFLRDGFGTQKYKNGREYRRSECRSCHAQYQREYKQKNLERCNAQVIEWKRNNRERVRELERNNSLHIKEKVFCLFGSKCQRCGFDDIRALQIDHINRAKESRGHPHRQGNGLYRAILRGEKSLDQLQLLCANCNWIKRYENDECAAGVI